ncbi:MAG TPA: ATP-binding protein, partial [Casimicrobiaceae bacterium]|nr:ATP-binding protein [Casimicrobiaceae bacterium]
MNKANIQTVLKQTDPTRAFEQMLAELSARFINLPAPEVDNAINNALRRIAQMLGCDRSQLIRLSAQGDDARVTHSGAVGDIPAVPVKSVSQLYPWVLRRLRQGQPVVISNVDAMPTEAIVDQASFRRAGTRANLSMPLRVAGLVEGVITFGCLRATRDWSEDVVARISVLAEVFANALAHKRAKEELDDAIRFERLMSRILTALLLAGRPERDCVIDAGLRDVAQAFGAERATLWKRIGNSDEFIKTHRWLADGVPNPPETIGGGVIPWMRARLIAGEIVRFTRHAELPSDAHADLTTLCELGIHDGVIVPLAVSGNVVGALSFANSRVDRPWPDALISRVTLLGEVFASLLAREASERRERDAQTQAAHAARIGTMGMLAASLVHEITQPLAASLANAETAAELLAATSPNLEEIRATVADVVADDRRAGELIQQLRRYLRRGETNKVEFDLGAVIDEILRLVESDATAKNIVVDVDRSQPLPNVFGDRGQLQQVLLNLVMNAVDAVATRDTGARHVRVAVHNNEAGQIVEVSDTGPGMDEATLARVFEPFFTTKPGGMGLGLSISRTIVASHGGTLTVHSTPGDGATFRLVLPTAARSHAVPDRSRKAASATTHATVFVIDDDPSMRRALERQLRSAGYNVETFASADDFLAHPAEHGVACVVSDVRMPGTSGLDLQSSLTRANRALPIVFVSAHGDIPTAVHALKGGAIAFLAKPFTKEDLLASVAEA